MRISLLLKKSFQKLKDMAQDCGRVVKPFARTFALNLLLIYKRQKRLLLRNEKVKQLLAAIQKNRILRQTIVALQNNAVLKHAVIAIQKNSPLITITALFVVLILGVGVSAYRFITPPVNPQKPIFQQSWRNANQLTANMPQVGIKTTFQAQAKTIDISVSRENSRLELAIPFENATSTINETNPSKMTFSDDKNQISVEYQAVRNGIKEDIILNQDPQTHLFSTKLHLENLHPIVTQDKQIYFVNNKGEYQFQFEQPYAQDKSGNTTYAVQYHLVEDTQENKSLTPAQLVQIQTDEMREKMQGTDTNVSTLTTQLLGSSAVDPNITTQILGPLFQFNRQKNYILVLEVQKEWLFSPERMYPIRIDPTIVHNETSEFASGTFDRTIDTGSGSSPSIEGFHQIPAYDIHTMAYYKLDETSGTVAADETGNGYTGTVTGATIVDGMSGFGKARSFTGTNYIQATSPTTYLRSRTISVWFTITALGTQRGIVSVGNTSLETGPLWLLIQSSTNQLSIYSNGYQTGKTILTTNRWYHAAYTYNSASSEVKLYLDGNLEFSGVVTEPNFNNTNLYIGRGYNASHNGLIDELRIDSVVRTEEEIKAMAQRPPSAAYTSDTVDLGASVMTLDTLAFTATENASDTPSGGAETPYSTTGLVAQWNLNETSGTTAVSGGSCGATCNGTLTNFTDTTGQDVVAQSGWTATQRHSGAGAVNFDGSNDYIINSPNNTGITGNAEITLEAWIYPRNFTGNQTVLGLIPAAVTTGQTAAILLNQAAANTIGFHTSSAGVNTGPILQLNKWQHIVITKTPGTLTTSTKIYLNGVDQPYTLVGSNVTPSFNPTRVQIGSGWWNGATVNPFNGIIDTTRIYSRALSAEEVVSNYNSSRIMFETRTSADGSTWEEWRPTGTPVDIDITSWNAPTVPTIASTNDTTITNDSASSRKIITTSGKANYVIQSYTATGGHTWNRPSGVTEVDVLVVAGGGGGGGTIGGGGGGGGVIYQREVDVSASPTVSVQVGTGGTGGGGNTNPAHYGGTGGNSYFGSVIASGGGGGGPNAAQGCTTTAGGSGGGGSTSCAGGTGTAGQGFNGGTNGANNNAGGGGGAVSPGASGVSTTRSGNGGTGFASDISGGNIYYGGGGGGGARTANGTAGAGGLGGGGAGTTTSTLATAGTANTGGGGGGAGYNGDTAIQLGGNGGSGIVIIRYLAPDPNDNSIGHWSFDETTVTPQYYLDTFSTAGTDTWYRPSDVTSVDVLVVAGGGGGGGVIGGGGGAGGMVEQLAVDVSATPTVAVTVGLGGIGGNGFNTATQQGNKGGNSVFGSITATGGGGGGPIGGASTCTAATSNGGSGGGASAGTGFTTCWGTGIGGQGNNGGAGAAGGNNAGGGGGAGVVGAVGVNAAIGGAGGVGKISDIPGIYKLFSGGGGGGVRTGFGTAGGGGGGGGGTGTTTSAVAGAGTTNTGSGGGGAGFSVNSTSKLGGDGGNGIVLVKYASQFPNPDAEPIYTATDYSGNNHHGTYKQTSITRGIIGNARSFNGSTSAVTLPSSADFNVDSFSVEAWVYSSNFNQSGYIYEKSSATGEQTIIGCGFSGANIVFNTRSGPSTFQSQTTSNILQKNSWNHVACHYSKELGQKTIWVNGVLANVVAHNLTMYNSSTDKQSIGYSLVAAYYNTPAFFNGKIDDVHFYNGINRTYEDITNAYQLGIGNSVPLDINGATTLNKDVIAFDIAADRPGTYLELVAGDSYESTLRPDPNPTGSTGYWKFDEASRAPLINQGNSKKEGVLVNAFNRAPGVTGNGLYLVTASSQYANLQTNLNQSTQFTLSAWFKTNQGTTRTLVGFSQEIPGSPNTASRVPVISILSTGVVRGEFWTGGVGAISSAIGYNDSRWHHVVMVADNTNQYMYLDGQLIGSRAGTIDHSWWYHTTVGAGYGTTTRSYASDAWSYFTGNIDEVQLIESTLTEAEIREIYEAGIKKKSYPITISFGAKINSGNLIDDNTDNTFIIDATQYKYPEMGSNIFEGERIIVKENVAGTEYIAQGIVSTVTSSTGAITVQGWDTGSTFPPDGFTPQADVFKWQREYWDYRKATALPTSNSTLTSASLFFTNGAEGRTVWIDNPQSLDSTLTDATSSVPTSTPQRYLQYRARFLNSDTNHSVALQSVTLDYATNQPPAVPSLDAPSDTVTNLTQNPTLQTTTTDTNGDEIRYRIILCEDVSMTVNCQTYDQTVTQSGWSGQNALSSTAYTSGTQASYTISMDLALLTTYYWKSQAIDPNDSNTWSALQATPYSFTTTNNNAPTVATGLQTNSLTNPTAVTTLVPTFSAIYNDPEITDQAVSYQLQISPSQSFAPGIALWSGAFSPYVDEGDRTPEISYNGPPLSVNGQRYYWRIRLTDPLGAVSPWSTESATFTMFNLALPTQCVIDSNPLNTTFTVSWNDGTTGESGYELERQVNGGAWTLLNSPAANTTSYADSTIAQGSTYKYRVRSLIGAQTSEWCTTSMVSPNIGDFILEGVGFSGVNIN